jgi:hypothetical protein
MDGMDADGKRWDEEEDFSDHGFHGWTRMGEPAPFILIRENP